MAEALKRAVLARGQSKGAITKLYNFVNEKEKYYTQDDKDFSDVEDKYYVVLSFLEEQISLLAASSSASAGNSNKAPTENSVSSLPPISLAKFTGEVSGFHDFITLFKSVIHNNTKLSLCDKFYYLKTLLVGEPADLIKHLNLTSENYATALELLDERYNKKSRVINLHINSLLDIKPITKCTPLALRDMVSKTKQHVAALINMGVPAQQWDYILIAILQRKIDQYSLRCFHLELKDSEPNLEQFLKFLDQRASSLESVADQTQPSSHLSSRRASLVTATAGKPTTTKVTSQTACRFCSGRYHRLHQCEKFKLAPITDRLNYVKENTLCELCLNKHNNKCRLLYKCTVCKQKHNSLLHQDEPSQPLELPKVSSLSMSKSDNILLPTVKVKLFDAIGNEIFVRALCDSGSQVSFILSDLASKINCKLYNEPTSFVGVCDAPNTVKQKAEVEIYSVTNDNHLKVTCSIIDNITCDLPQFHINRNKLNLPSNIALADPEFHVSEPISILLGCDIFFELLLRDQLPVVPGGLYLHNTTFGYVVAGKVPHNSGVKRQQVSKMCGHVCTPVSQPINDIENIMQQFWKCESVPETYREATSEQVLAEKIFTETVVLEKGKFQVDLPLKQNLSEINMGDSLSRALSRFHNLEKRFNKDPVLFQKYKDFIDEYVSLAHAKYVDIEVYDLESGQVFFMPHHPVYNENSKTTRLRVVFDGSMNTYFNFSLNDMLLNGPCVQNDLFNILVLFRLHKYVLIADIQKMFRQVNLNPEHCSLQNILWRDSSAESVKCIQLQTVTYGLKSSTFLATRCLKELAERYGDQYPLAASVLANNTYVDDVNTGNNDLNQLLQTKNQLIELLKLGGFNLHKWCANDESLLQDIPKELHHLSDVDFCKDENASIKALGITYKIQSDTLNISSPKQVPCDAKKYTKRQVLSFIGRFFDPLGLGGPITVAAKVIMQKTWQLKTSWDSELPDELVNEFKCFIESLSKMNNISVNRNINTHDVKTIQLVGYSDASCKAQASCLYIRTIDNNGKVDVNLLCSKSKINPIDPLSIPRLELNSALLLANLLNKVYDQISKLGHTLEVYLHSDSKVVLAWLGTEPARLSVYVANRVKQINDLTKKASWSYVNTADNPADCLSRGVEPHLLQDNKLWWHGPQCLMSPEYNFKKEFDTPSEIPEIKACNVTSVPPQKFELLSKYSSVHKLIRVVAYIYRFFNNCRANKADRITRSTLFCKELDVALKIIIRVDQKDHFAQETKALLGNQPIKSNLKQLNPFIDNMGIIRVGGRLQQAGLPFCQQHPIILPKKSIITKLIIRDEHRISLHANAKTMIGNLAQRYYIINCKREIKHVVHRCIICFKLKAKASQQLMGSLPADRVRPSRAFEKVGVDFGGPFLVKMHRVRKPLIYKAYIALFVCFTTKAIHIELVSSLTTECFLQCLKRFIARRNRPSVIHCDNASTYRGAQNQLREFYSLQRSKDHQDTVTNFASTLGIEFNFIPSYSPVFGGLWEAGIKSAKYHLKRVVGQQVLTYEELNSVVIQIEGILNSRPLLSLQTMSPDDMSYLTPAHFLTGCSLSSYPEPDLTNVPINRISFWKQCTKMMQCFWKEWSRQYLLQLQNRPKWHKNVPNIEKGTLVLLKLDNAPPLTWQTARVVDTFPGADGKVRALNVRTSKGTIIRTSVTKVCVLPIDDDN